MSTIREERIKAGTPLPVRKLTAEEYADVLWNVLDADNKVSLFVRYIDIASGETETRIVNKNA